MSSLKQLLYAAKEKYMRLKVTEFPELSETSMQVWKLLKLQNSLMRSWNLMERWHCIMSAIVLYKHTHSCHHTVAGLMLARFVSRVKRPKFTQKVEPRNAFCLSDTLTSYKLPLTCLCCVRSYRQLQVSVPGRLSFWAAHWLCLPCVHAYLLVISPITHCPHINQLLGCTDPRILFWSYYSSPCASHPIPL